MAIDWVRAYECAILRHPRTVLVATALMVASLGWFAQDFELDASADSLTLEHDRALSYYHAVRGRYGSDSYLIVTFTPSRELFAEETLLTLARLRDALAALPAVDTVTSILDVPLLSSPPLQLRNLPEGIRTLDEPGTDPGLARHELLNSPLYRNFIVSGSGRTTALQVVLREDEAYLRLRRQRDELRETLFNGELGAAEQARLRELEVAVNEYSRGMLQRERETIASVRAVLDDFRDRADISLGGVPMIVADSIRFIRHDMLVFGIAVVVFLLVILGVAFRSPRWVVLPLLTCAATSVIMVGLLGLLNWRVTVVSSNFLSLILILCLSLTLHIIVRYREAHTLNPEADQYVLVGTTVRRIVVPCFYTTLTTMVAFGSLIVSGIRPVIDFGWMMVMGTAVGFLLAFTMLPAGMLLLSPGKPRPRRDLTAAITAFFARTVRRHDRGTVGIFSALLIAGLLGSTRLTVENRFIDYYRESTEIYQGMQLIDRELGGTTPLDVIIDAPAEEQSDTARSDEADEFEDIYADEDSGAAGITAESYWFNSRQLPRVMAMHEQLTAIPQTGKVISIATAAELLRQIDPSILQDNITLSVLFRKLPARVRAALIDPYLSPDGNQLRFSIRVFESDPGLRRSQLLERIRHELETRFDLAPEQIHLSGMLVLYNNMLQSLFESQILTLGAVFIAILLMFVFLFGSFRLSLTAIIPNIVSAALVLGIMGWLGIPLDLMTITIAAITIGIAVDDTIHYVHRFRHELAQDRDYWAAVRRCHHTIGRAMYYTSITVMLGFSILTLSQFVPTAYFGLLTGVAMLIALFANLLLLPVLLVWFRPRRG